MKNSTSDNFAERLKAAAAARQTLLSRFKPKAASPAPEHVDRAAERALALAQVRDDRAQAKAAKRDAAATVLAARDLEAADGTPPGERTDIEAKARRDARYAARQARR